MAHCNWVLAFGKRGNREFEGCFRTKEAAEKMAIRLNGSGYCHGSSCWRPIFSPPPGVPLAGPKPTQQQMYYKAVHQSAEARKLFSDIMTGPNPLTKAEIKSLIAKRPDKYGYMRAWVK